MYDVIIVGARVSGAPLGMLLAQKGHKVLIVDKATFPSDVKMSTHLLHQEGVRYLRKWGLEDRLKKSGCPPLMNWHVDVGPMALKGAPIPAEGGVKEAYAPRRIVLDKILVDAAKEAKAEVREGFTMEGLLQEGGRVVGIRGKNADGKAVEERAKIVVGADGGSSQVAALVGAKKYNERPSMVGTVFAYFSGVPMLPGTDVEFYPRVHRAVYVWQTHNGHTLIGANWKADEIAGLPKDLAKAFIDNVEACAPDVAKRVRAGKAESEYLAGYTPNFMREAHGPGWALAGDAGAVYEFCTGQGITNNFRSVELLVDALHAGLSGASSMDAALAQYQTARDNAEMPFYDFTYNAMTLGPPDEQTLALFGAMAKNGHAMNQFLGVIAETVHPGVFFSPDNMAKVFGAP